MPWFGNVGLTKPRDIPRYIESGNNEVSNMASTAGQYIVQKMDHNGLTTKDVKNALGLKSEANVSDWRNDRRPVPEKHVRPLAKILRCDYSTLKAKNDGKLTRTTSVGHTPVAVQVAEIPSKQSQPALNGWTRLTVDSLPKQNDYVHLYCAKGKFYRVGQLTKNPIGLVGRYTHFMKVEQPELPKV